MIKYKWLIITAWIGVAIAFTVFSPNLSTLVSKGSSSSIPNNYSSQVAEKIIQDVKVAEHTENQIEVALLFNQSQGLTAEEMLAAENAINLLNQEKSTLGIERILTHFDDETYKPMLVSEEGESILAMITIEENGRTATDISNQLSKVTQSVGVNHYYTSTEMIEEAFSKQVTSKVTRVLVAGLILLVLTLMVLYRSVISPVVIFLPIGMSILIADGLFSIIAQKFAVPVNMYSFYLLFAITMVAGVLYSNILLKKVKEYSITHRTLNGIEGSYFNSAYKAIVTSGTALTLAFATVLWSEFVFYQTLAVASVGMLVITLVSSTFTPALAAVFGDKLFWPYMNKASTMSPFTRFEGFSYKRPFVILVATLVVITPIFWTVERAFSYNPLDGASDELTSIKAFNIISKTFGPGKSVPIEIVVQNDEKMDNLHYLTLIEQMSREISGLPGVEEIRSATRPFGTEIEDFLVINQVDTLQEGLGKGKDGVDLIAEGLSGAVTSIEGSSPQLAAAGDGVTQLISGTNQLQSGVTKLGNGVEQIATGLQDGVIGAGKLKAGADTAAQSTNQLVDGSKQLYAGYQQVEQGMTPLKGGVDQVKNGVNKLQKEGVDGLKAGVGQLKTGVGDLSVGVGELKTGAAGVNAGVDQVKGAVDTNVGNISNGLSGLEQLLSGLAATTPGIEENDYFQQAKGTVSQLRNGTGELKAGLHGGLDKVKGGVGQLSGGLNDLQAGLGKVDAGLDGLNGGVNQVGTGLSSLSGGLDQVNGGLNKLETGVGTANSNFGKVISGQEQLAQGLGTLSGGIGELKTGIGRAANGQQQVLQNIPKLSAGLGEIGGGHLQLKDGFTSIGGKMGELGVGLGTGIAGLGKVSNGLTDAMGYLQNLSNSPNEQAAGWFIPEEIINSEMFEQVFDTYLSKDRKVFTMEVVLANDAFSKDAIATKTEIESIVKNVSNGTPLENAVTSIGGKTSVSADTAQLAEKEFIPTALILLLVLFLALIIFMKSVTGAISSVLTTGLVSFVSLAIVQMVFGTIVWGIPLFVFMIMAAIMTIATVSYITAVQDGESNVAQSGFKKSLTLFALGLFTLTLLFSGVVALQQGAAIVLIATAICAFFVIPIWLPAMTRLFGLGNWVPTDESATAST